MKGRMDCNNVNKWFELFTRAMLGEVMMFKLANASTIFGMTRTGQSNTVKTIVKAIYQKRFSTYQPKKIGQIIFDPNGEYANENTQDKDDKTGAAQAIKNLWKIPHNSKHGNPDDIKIYSLVENPDDPQRIIMKINFFDDKLIQIGKDLIDLKIVNIDDKLPNVKINIIYNSKYLTVAPKKFINMYIDKTIN